MPRLKSSAPLSARQSEALLLLAQPRYILQEHSNLIFQSGDPAEVVKWLRGEPYQQWGTEQTRVLESTKRALLRRGLIRLVRPITYTITPAGRAVARELAQPGEAKR